MALHSLLSCLLIGILYHVALAVPQAPLNAITESPSVLQTALPDLEGPNTAEPSCGGCYLVADVAGLVWYSEIFLNTAATAIVSVGVGNGTRATRTSVVQDAGEFTFNPSGTMQGTGALTQVNFESTLNVGGALLTSPTAYNVFTAYSVTSAYESDNVCVTSSGPSIPLSTAYSQILPSASGRVYLDAGGQRQFIDYLGFSSCSGGGENLLPTALIQVFNTTATMTTTFSGFLAAVSASLTIAPQSSPASVSASDVTGNPSFPSAGIPEIVIGNTTITPTANPIDLPVYNGSTFSLPTGTPIPTRSSRNMTNTPVPFIGEASHVADTNKWLGVWVAGMMGLGVGVYYL